MKVEDFFLAINTFPYIFFKLLALDCVQDLATNAYKPCFIPGIVVWDYERPMRTHFGRTKNVENWRRST